MSTFSVIIVDEQDPSVVFTGQWDHLADPVQYKGFATGSQTAGTTCSLNFTGTSVIVVTTVVRDAPFSLQFNLDGTLYSNSSTGINNFANVGIYSYHDSTFTIGNLSEGNHVLTISNSLATTDIGIFIDYFLYTPSSQTNLSNLNLFIDDRDPSLQYAGNWRFDTADSDFRHTSRAADDTSLANVTIPFTGDGIQFYGLINNGSVGDMLLAEFVLDGTSTTTYAPPAQTSDITYNNKLYDSGALPQKSHKLVVTPKNGHLVWLDYVLVHQAVTTQATHTSSSSTSIATSAGASTTGPTMVPVTTFNHRSVNVGAIVGGVIGGVALILVLILGLFLLRRKQRNLSDNDVNEQHVPYTYSPPSDTTPIPPRDLKSIPTQSVTSPMMHASASYSTSEVTSSDLSPISARNLKSLPSASSPLMNTSALYSTSETIASPSVTEVSSLVHSPQPSVVHTDSGIRLAYHVAPNPENALGSPPVYTVN